MVELFENYFVEDLPVSSTGVGILSYAGKSYNLFWKHLTLKKNLTPRLDFLKSFLLVKLDEGFTSFIPEDDESKYMINLSSNLLAKRFSGFLSEAPLLSISPLIKSTY